MKFSLLAVGQQFEYQGETYIKSTPLIAHQVDTGEQRLIPRSATVISNAAPPPAPAAGDKTTIDPQQIRSALLALEEELQEFVSGDARLARAFAQARQRFFERLGMAPVASRTDDHSTS